MSDSIARYASRTVANHPPITLGLLGVVFELSPISANVRSHGTIQVPALYLRGSASDWYPIVLN
jgi:hypothetical protein